MYTRIVRHTCCLLLSGLLLALPSCEKGKAEILSSTRDEQTVVMTIDGFDVPMELYRYVALNYKDQYEDGADASLWLGESGETTLAELNTHVEETLIKLYTTRSLCADYGINIDSDYIRNTLGHSMESIYEGYENDYEAYADYLAQYHMNDSVYRFFVLNDILAEELVAAMVSRGEIDAEDVTVRDLINSHACVRVKQILIGDNGKSDAENHTTAEEAYNRAMAGENFEDLITAYGNDLFMFNNPDGYYVIRGNYHTAFEDAAFALDIGELSAPILTDAGYSILKCYEKEDTYIDKHFDELKESYINGQYNIALEAHEKTLTVTPTDALADYTIFTMTAED